MCAYAYVLHVYISLAYLPAGGLFLLGAVAEAFAADDGFPWTSEGYALGVF